MAPCRAFLFLCWLGVVTLFAPEAGAQKAVPPLTGRVVDEAGILSPETERLLAGLLAEHEAATGNQVAVLTVPSLDGENLEDYSLRVARTWALGTAEHDNGVLLLVAVADRKLRIEVGLGLEGALPDAVAARIIRHEMTPRFRNGDFNGGVVAGVQAIVGAIEGTYTPPEDPAGKPPFWAGLIFLVVPCLFAFFGLISHGCGRWFLFGVLMPFFWVAGSLLFGFTYGGWIVLLLYVVAFVALTRHPGVQAVSEKLKAGQKAKVGPFTFTAGSGGFAGGGGGGFGGGGFSGGGGSFGGGGASGGW
ncbi:MAG: hypothetical protein KatS3mg043_0014 [Rhodothermaceae bacterium]|nr:MAG: hypothetical protein KatS3mg043_0014 [Rhodothermaceae bacterium]